MSIIASIRHLLPSKHKERLRRIREIPEERRADELSAVFYDESIARAARFVQEQIARGEDSPFCGAARDRFFHEIMAVNFWALEKIFGANQGMLVAHVVERYARFFHETGHRPGWIEKRCAVYNKSWNDITGHQDGFGRAVAEHVFPGGQAFSVPETSYWIIEYAYEVLDALRGLRGLCRSQGIVLPSSTQEA